MFVGPSISVNGSLVFTVAGMLGLIATVIAWNSRYFRELSAAYLKGTKAEPVEG